MALRNRFEPLLREAAVLRLIPLTDKFLPNGSADLPVGEAFVPTTEDKEEGKNRNRQAMVSVWEHGLTTLEQALAIREKDANQAGRSPPKCVAFWFGVGAIIDCGTTRERLRVLSDPRPDSDGPGAVGHAGIEGLVRESGEQKKAWREMLDKIAQRAMRTPPA